ncbi:MAG: FHA domain-containing protein [Ilumatobacteraceae bacterium]
MTTTVRLVVTAGAGLLARRDDALLFASSTTWDHWSDVLERFADAARTDVAVDIFLGEVVAASFEVDAFVLLTWSSSSLAIVFGDIELTSDLSAMPMISGRGSTTWVEHRLVVPEQGCRLHAGVAVTGPGRLTGGIVPGDGFELILQRNEALVDQVSVPLTEPLAEPLAEPADGRADAWAALHDAAGGNWMDESLGLPPKVTAQPLVAVPVPAPPEPLPAPPATPPPKRPSGPPPMPVFDPETTLGPDEPVATVPVAPAIAVAAIGVVELPDGNRLPIRGTVVLGRHPDAAAARVDGDAVLCRLDVGADVSRTHLVVRANGPTIEAIDCGSSGHTVLMSAGTDEPVLLEPWVPHELTAGDTLYLGGPTQVRIVE